MVATVVVTERNTTAFTATKKTTLSTGTIRFKNADNATVDSNNRMVIPTAGSTGRDYSFEKWIQLRVDVAPAVDIQNIKAYSDGTGFGTGVKVWYHTSTAADTVNGPQQPSSANDPPHVAASTTNMTNFFTATSGSAISLSSTSYSSTGFIGNYLVMVLEVESSATQGTLTPEVLTFSYDET